MANSDVFSNIMGYSSKYTECPKSQINDDTDYNGVDFCQGEKDCDDKYSLFFDSQTSYSNDYSSNDCLFNFDAEIDENLG